MPYNFRLDGRIRVTRFPLERSPAGAQTCRMTGSRDLMYSKFGPLALLLCMVKH